jgi:hypothetical protein
MSYKKDIKLFHSYLSASTGLSFDALYVGMIPARIPMPTDTDKAIVF